MGRGRKSPAFLRFDGATPLGSYGLWVESRTSRAKSLRENDHDEIESRRDG